MRHLFYTSFTALTLDPTYSNTTFTTLVRAGIPCTSAYVAEGPAAYGPSDVPPPARCSEGIRILPDTFFSPEACTPDAFDLLVVPGGSKSSEIMAGSATVRQAVRRFLDAGRVVGMICAGSCSFFFVAAWTGY